MSLTPGERLEIHRKEREMLAAFISAATLEMDAVDDWNEAGGFGPPPHDPETVKKAWELCLCAYTLHTYGFDWADDLKRFIWHFTDPKPAAGGERGDDNLAGDME